MLYVFAGGVLTLIVLILGILLFQPRWLLTILARASPGVIYYARVTQPVVALTIDDGPDAIATPKILEALAKHRTKATFFLFSERIAGNEAIVEEILARGHEIGNHLRDDTPSIFLSAEQFTEALEEAHEILSQFASPRWFRPGSGWYNSRMLASIRQFGYRCVLGSLHPWDGQITSPRFSRFMIHMNVLPGSIIVLHDGAARGHRTAAVLERLLPELQSKGYQVTTLSDLVDAEAAYLEGD
jgi:peptidoglycan/xylan/chitin deacetylase (PgdA/CDA1 family)